MRHPRDCVHVLEPEFAIVVTVSTFSSSVSPSSWLCAHFSVHVAPSSWLCPRFRNSCLRSLAPVGQSEVSSQFGLVKYDVSWKSSGTFLAPADQNWKILVRYIVKYRSKRKNGSLELGFRVNIKWYHLMSYSFRWLIDLWLVLKYW